MLFLYLLDSFNFEYDSKSADAETFHRAYQLSEKCSLNHLSNYLFIQRCSYLNCKHTKYKITLPFSTGVLSKKEKISLASCIAV